MQENKLETRKREIIDSVAGLKHSLGAHFEEIRQKLDAKEREIMQRLDD